jgi:hypothetical protein
MTVYKMHFGPELINSAICKKPSLKKSNQKEEYGRKGYVQTEIFRKREQHSTFKEHRGGQ